MPRRGGKKTRKIRKRRKRRKTRKRKGGMKRRRSTFGPLPGPLPESEPRSKKLKTSNTQEELKTPNTQEAHQARTHTPLPLAQIEPETKSDYAVSRKYQIRLMFANLPDGHPDKRYIWEFGGTEDYIELWNLKSKAVWVLKQPDNIEKIPTGPGMLDWRTIIIKDLNRKELGMRVLPEELENNNDEQYKLLLTKNNEQIREGTIVIVELPPPPTGGGINKRKRLKTRKRKKKRKTRKRK